MLGDEGNIRVWGDIRVLGGTSGCLGGHQGVGGTSVCLGGHQGVGGISG